MNEEIDVYGKETEEIFIRVDFRSLFSCRIHSRLYLPPSFPLDIPTRLINGTVRTYELWLVNTNISRALTQIGNIGSATDKLNIQDNDSAGRMLMLYVDSELPCSIWANEVIIH